MEDYTSTYTGAQVDAAIAAIAGMTALTDAEIDTIWNNAMPTIISFTIYDTSYQAVEGMTWQEWVNSEYNTGNAFSIEGGSVKNGTLTIEDVTASSTIQENYNYTYSSGSSGGSGI